MGTRLRRTVGVRICRCFPFRDAALSTVSRCGLSCGCHKHKTGQQLTSIHRLEVVISRPPEGGVNGSNLAQTTRSSSVTPATRVPPSAKGTFKRPAANHQVIFCWQSQTERTIEVLCVGYRTGPWWESSHRLLFIYLCISYLLSELARLKCRHLRFVVIHQTRNTPRKFLNYLKGYSPGMSRKLTIFDDK